MKHILGWILTAIIAPSAWSIVDMKNANYAHTFVDMEVPGSGYDLKIERTYSSRSLFSGIFGFGWCSSWETKLDVTAEGYLRVTECGAGQQLTYKPKKFDPKAVDKTIVKIMEEVKKRNKGKPESFFKNLAKEIKDDPLLRQEFEKQLELKGNVAEGKEYIVDGRDNETIILKGDNYYRTLPDGSKQRFNKKGQLDAMYDRNGNYLKFSYTGELLTQALDNNGRKLAFKYNTVTKKVKQIVGPGSLKAEYAHKGEDLIKAKNAWGNTFTYAYDDLHNLTKIAYPDKTSRELKYDKDKDWVLAFKDRKNCTENYEYKSDPEDPKNHYWSTVVKRCNKKVTNRSTYEFWHKEKYDGTGKFLYRVRSDVNGNVTDIVYHEVFGKPISVVRGNSNVKYRYYDDGRVQRKTEPLRIMDFAYKGKCDKVSEVKVAYLQPPTQEKTPKKGKKGKKRAEKKVIRTVVTQFKYDDKKCNLIFARNSIGQTAKLAYDSKGRISSIEDQSEKVVSIKYEGKFGKPAIVSRPGLGTIYVKYDSSGEVADVKSKDGPKVAVQVASIFNNLLDIIAPATSETPL